MNRKRILALVTLVALLLTVCGCGTREQGDRQDDKDQAVAAQDQIYEDKLQVVATLFPQYDFARTIAGDRADVTMLLPPGVETHSFDPRPSDIITMSRADMLIYTGDSMEPWSQKVIEGLEDFEGLVVDVSKGLTLAETSAHEEGHKEEEHHVLAYEPHIWTDPNMAKVMVDTIVEAFCKIDPDYASVYRANGEKYKADLEQLDKEFREVVQNGNHKKLIFGSRFALYYFTKQYGLDYEAAFDSCSSETEPSARMIAHLIKTIEEENIKVIYYAELSDLKVAESISRQTGAKMLLFHSGHNVSKEEFQEGATYLSLMKQNAENLKEGLQ